MLLDGPLTLGAFEQRLRDARDVGVLEKEETTEQNLLRVTDVLGEIKRQISSIERQAKKDDA